MEGWSIKVKKKKIPKAIKRKAATKRKSKPSRIQKPLTKREKECLYWASEGTTGYDTAEILDISERTVIFHMQNAISKLNAKNRTHAVVIAISRGLISVKI